MSFNMSFVSPSRVREVGCKRVRLYKGHFKLDNLAKRLDLEDVFIAVTEEGFFATVVESSAHLASLIKNFGDLTLWVATMEQLYTLNGNRVGSVNSAIKDLRDLGHLKYTKFYG